MEELWRESRWIMDALQNARYKQPTGGILLSWLMDFSQETLPETPRSTSSAPEYLPSPPASPDSHRKHSGQALPEQHSV